MASLGPGGTFIDTVHTAEHFREELWFPEILDRQYYEPWTDGGAPSTEALCGQRKQAILGDHEPEPLSLDLAREIQRIEQAADAELLG